MTGRASPSALNELWRATKESLTEGLRRRKVPSAELLGVARRFLRDNGALGAPDEAARADLEMLHRLYRERLLEGLAQPKPSPILLAEARQYWTHHKSNGNRTLSPSGTELAHLDIPFRTKQ